MKLNHCWCPTCRDDRFGFRLADHEGAPRDHQGRVVAECLACAHAKMKREVATARRMAVTNEVKMLRAIGGAFQPAGVHHG